MSDEEDIVYVKKQKTIHYGSLETSEREKLSKEEAPEVKTDSGQINTSSDYYDIEQEM
jgi:U4/U6 small nuclear ribonucleoprotein PRP4